LRVLVAEDHAVNQEVAAGLLERMGCEVFVAQDGEEAVAVALREQLHLILMDCQMPKLDGFGATSRIRAAEANGGPRRRIVALTANAMTGDRERCLAAGMDGFLSKPFRAAELRALIERLCRDPLGLAPAVAAPGGSPNVGGADATSDAVLDHAAIGELRALGAGALEGFIDLFATTSEPLLEEIDGACRDADDDRVRRAAHALRSSCVSVGARELANLLEVMEQLGPEACGPARVRQAYTKALGALRAATCELPAARAKEDEVTGRRGDGSLASSEENSR
jgi:CheY-like chemotaxis protein